MMKIFYDAIDNSSIAVVIIHFSSSWFIYFFTSLQKKKKKTDDDFWEHHKSLFPLNAQYMRRMMILTEIQTQPSTTHNREEKKQSVKTWKALWGRQLSLALFWSCNITRVSNKRLYPGLRESVRLISLHHIDEYKLLLTLSDVDSFSILCVFFSTMSSSSFQEKWEKRVRCDWLTGRLFFQLH